MKYQLRLDYATFNFLNGTASVESISNTLAGSTDLCWTKKGLSDNAPIWSPLGLRWVDNSGFETAPHCLRVSGVGCEHFAATLPALRSGGNSYFSRLDFAFDVVMPRKLWREYIKDAFCASMDSERQRKKFRLDGHGEAMTIYIGSRKAAKYFRIYNKTLQDEKYQYYDAEIGKDVEVSEDECVIRYEVELKRHKVVRNNRVELFDPSPLFDWYYSEDEELRQKLYDVIKQMWVSFGSEGLLPPLFFQEAEFEARILSKCEILLHNSAEERLEIVKEKLHDYPHTFDATLSYVANKFGAYIPYLLADAGYRNLCFESCKIKFGFVPDYIIEPVPAGFYDMDCEEDDEEVFELGWSELLGDQTSFEDIDN